MAQSLKAEAEAFKGRLASLYKDQLDRLSDMAHYDEAKSDEKLEEAIEEADQEFEAVSAKAADMHRIRLAAKSNLWQYKLASTAKHNEWSGYKNKKQSRCRRIKK